MRTIPVVVALGALAGCANAPSRGDVNAIEEARATAPTCQTDEECARLMAAAKTVFGTMRMPPLEVDTPTRIKTFDRGSYWLPTMVGEAELISADDVTRKLVARFGGYGPGGPPFYDPKLASVTVTFNREVKAAAGL